ncbi:hypothetical protein P8452_65469 [Trifolium repens]|nr:hypothetical protein P8452_65469 [Trifolium repens]
MDNKIRGKKVHCLVLVYPAQGHVNPMLQFSKLLQHEGVKVTLVTTLHYRKTLQSVPPSIAIETISDGFDNGGVEEAGDYKTYLGRFWQVGPKTLAELIEKLGILGDKVDCVIYDSFFTWALDVAKRFGIIGVSYLTQNIRKSRESSFAFDMLVGQFSNIHKADWILCNTFYEMEKEIADWTMNIWPKFRPIGPSIPSMFLDKRLKDDEDYGVAQFKTNEKYMEWLNNKPKGSVVYVSFGTMVSLDEEQVQEVAYGLRDSGSYFLWVSEKGKEIKINATKWKNLAVGAFGESGSSQNSILEFVTSLFNDVHGLTN